jgi:hypothetical protein
MTEMLIYIGITSIALVMFMNFFVDVSRATSRSRVAKEVDQNGRIVVDRIIQDVRTANSVTVTDPKTLQVSGTTVNTYTLPTSPATVVKVNGVDLTTPSVKVNDPGSSFVTAGGGVLINLSVQGRDGTPGFQQKVLNLTSTVEPHKLLY